MWSPATRQRYTLQVQQCDLAVHMPTEMSTRVQTKNASQHTKLFAVIEEKKEILIRKEQKHQKKGKSK